MSDKVLLGLYFICLKGIFENDFESGRGFCRCGILRHRARSGRLTHVEEMVVTPRTIGLESAGIWGACGRSLPVESAWALLEANDNCPKNQRQLRDDTAPPGTRLRLAVTASVLTVYVLHTVDHTVTVS